jgi:hypothetical protein
MQRMIGPKVAICTRFHCHGIVQRSKWAVQNGTMWIIHGHFAINCIRCPEEHTCDFGEAGQIVSETQVIRVDYR